MNNKKNLLLKEKTQKQNRIWIRIACSCNNKCIFCLDSKAHNWTFIEKKNVLKQIKKWYKKWYENRVILSWWEASIDPKFSEYIKYAKEFWYDRVQTVTNWNMFAIESFCKKVFDAWLEEVTFSFHWHNSILHDYLVDTPWAFKKSLKWLIYIKKYYPKVIVNIDIVVNKINISYLPDIVKYFIKFWVYEYDILQIIPFWRGFLENKEKLFYNLEDYSLKLKETWQLSKIPGMYMWTNRFPPEAFEWYEDLIQDPRKIKGEVMWEAYKTFDKFITSNWDKRPSCFWDACNYCFQNQYCKYFLNNINKEKLLLNNNYIIIFWEKFPSLVYKKYWETWEEFKNNLLKYNKKLINIPKCLWWTGIYQTYNDVKEENSLEDYTNKYINNLYRKKSLRCRKCSYYDKCEGMHINFIRSYWFKILEPIFINLDDINTFISKIPKKLLDGTPLTLNHYSRFFDYILNNVNKISKILEIWCYFWLWVKKLEDYWYSNIFGCDSNKDIVEYSRSQSIKIKYIDIIKSLEKESYDFIYLVNFVHDDLFKWIECKSFFEKTFKNLYKILNKNWQILFNFQENNWLFFEKDLFKVTKQFNILELKYGNYNWKDKIFLLTKKNGKYMIYSGK